MTHTRRLPLPATQVLVLFLCLSFILAPSPSLAGPKADKVAGLGLSLAQATAESKDVAKAAEDVAKDEISNWVMGQLGGWSAIKAVNNYNDLNDKVTEITDMIATVQNVASQLGSGNYDQALIASTDTIVGKLNNPAVSAIWAASKAAYESHLLVQSTGAARDIEALYGIVEHDRMIIGEQNPDTPAQINVNSATVDYFFRDYVVTDAGTRALVKSYVTTALGQDWPEQTWGQYLSGAMAVGSGVDTKQADELAALTGELENVARGWIRSLLTDVNKQAMVRYRQMRMDQELAKFQDFAQRMGRFVNNDLPRLQGLYMMKERAKKRLPEFKKQLAESRAKFPPYEARIEKAMEAKKEGEKTSMFTILSTSTQELWGIVTELKRASESAMHIDAGLSTELEAESNRWYRLLEKVRDRLDAAEKILDEVKDKWALEHDKATRENNEFDRQIVERLRKAGKLPDPLPDYLQQQPIDAVQNRDLVMAKAQRYNIDTEIGLMSEVEAEILKHYNTGRFELASEAIALAHGDIQKRITDHYEGLRNELSDLGAKNKGKAMYLGEATSLLEQFQSEDEAWLGAEVSRLNAMSKPFYEIATYASGKWDQYNRFLQQMEDALTPKFWEQGLPTYELDTYTAISTFPNVKDLAGMPHAIRARVSTMQGMIKDETMNTERQRLKASRQVLETMKAKWRLWKKPSAKELRYFDAFGLGGDAPEQAIDKRVTAINNALNGWTGYLPNWESKITQHERSIRTNNNNILQDISYLAPKEMEMTMFIFNLSQHERMLMSDDRGQLSPYVYLNDAGEGALMEPYPHFMTTTELAKFGQQWLTKLKSYKEWPFIARTFPGVVKWAGEAAGMPHVTPASDDNMMYHSAPMYKKDVDQAINKAKRLDHEQEKTWTEALDEIAKLVPQSLKKTKNGWYTEDQTLNLEDDALRESKTGEAYAKLLELLDESITMRANYLKAQRNAAGAAEREAAMKAAQEAELAESYDLAAQSMFYVTDVRLNSKTIYDNAGQITVTRDNLDNGRIRITARLSEIEGVETMLLSIDGGRTWDQARVARDIGFEFLPAAGQRYEFVLRLKRGPGKDDVQFKLIPGSWVSFENVDYTQLVLNTVKELAEAYERQSVAGFSRLISRDYLGNRAFLEEGVRFDFDMFSAIQLKIFVNRITMSNGQATVATKWDKKQIPRSTGQQQTTSGKTTMTFVMEDGAMKIRNMRGNLLYATLSPEIAEASGLSQTVVDDIRTARDERNAVQPGAGETEDGGGVSAGLASTNATITSAGFPGTRYDFETASITAGGSQDLTFEGNIIIEQGSAVFQTSASSYDSLSTAPTAGYGFFPGASPYPGVYVFKTHEGNYGKMEILTETTVAGPITRYTIRFAVQADGSTNISTN
ncbi:hypothetical protein [Desulfovibrio ferrophilus]|uniref:Uncharacterized protein n=1 Tax=Desulfovibrio ferrophilus TaxID=241368 RepID=A0A2Z6B254_9BACT|nr:hypothetical protein [Desulfovibrio ferrophilus]BBD09518.1 uncharacterized protein DFE_2792 [Desulfovibrio ferrophilus]